MAQRGFSHPRTGYTKSLILLKEILVCLHLVYVLFAHIFDESGKCCLNKILKVFETAR